MGMDARSLAHGNSTAIVKPSDKADAASGANPEGKCPRRLIAALLLACAARHTALQAPCTKPPGTLSLARLTANTPSVQRIKNRDTVVSDRELQISQFN